MELLGAKVSYSDQEKVKKIIDLIDKKLEM